jgi:hypothetical protein
MYTPLNEVLVQLKLESSNYHPNIEDVLQQMQTKGQNF